MSQEASDLFTRLAPVLNVRDLAVGVAGESQEHGRPVGLAVRGGVDPAGSTRGDLAAGQVGGVLAAPGGPVAAGAVFAAGVGFAADAGGGQVAVELGEQLVQLAGEWRLLVGLPLP